MLRKLAFPIALVIALVAAFAGCGGGDDSSSASGESSNTPPEPITTSSLSKAAFVRQTNSICKDYREDRNRKFLAYFREKSPGASKAPEDLLLEAIKTIYVPSLNTEIQEIRELGAPKGDAVKIERFLVGFESSADAAAELKTTKAKAVVDQRFSKAAIAARKYGAAACAVG